MKTQQKWLSNLLNKLGISESTIGFGLYQNFQSHLNYVNLKFPQFFPMKYFEKRTAYWNFHFWGFLY